MSAAPLTLADYRAAYARGELTPTRAVADVLARVAAHDDPAIFITLRDVGDLTAEAAALEARGARDLPLYGVPVAVKDNIDVADLPTTAACPAFATTPATDAGAVARLRAAGALVIGKTNLDQFAAGLVGVRSPYGVPRNTFDAALVPGGSSSGSAVAVAAGLVPVALGTDTAGSGRVPAGLNNIVGLKPTLGAVSTAGVLPACRTLDCVSVFALTVADAYAVFQVLTAFDPADAFSREIAAPPLGALAPGLRVGVPDAASRRFAGDARAEAAFDAACGDLTALGLTPVPVDLTPFFAVTQLLYDGPWVAERYQAIRAFMEASPEALLPVTRSIIGRATAFSAADAFAGRYRLAELRRAVAPVWRTIDVLAVPTYPRPHTLDALAADPVGPNSELGTYTNFVNLLDLCALAVPGRFRSDGWPAGVTLLAPAGADARLAALGQRLHAAAALPLGATGRAAPPLPSSPAVASGDEIEIAVVGAHLSGLPLNGELLRLGARYLRAVATEPAYRLYALPGGPPARPGLLRTADGGAAIETEVWAMSPDAFGRFVAAIPAPLGLGTLRLADGSRPKGFLVESVDTVGALDISAHGGWRAYLARIV